MKAKMKLSVFLIAVIGEIKRIKRLATDEEIANLKFSRFKHSKIDECIYGQMTGDCSSDRAREIMPKKFDDIVDSFDNLKDSPKYKFEEQSFKKGNSFTALEKYLYMSTRKTHKHIFDFLKGKTKTLVIK